MLRFTHWWKLIIHFSIVYQYICGYFFFFKKSRKNRYIKPESFIWQIYVYIPSARLHFLANNHSVIITNRITFEVNDSGSCTLSCVTPFFIILLALAWLVVIFEIFLEIYEHNKNDEHKKPWHWLIFCIERKLTLAWVNDGFLWFINHIS